LWVNLIEQDETGLVIQTKGHW